MSDKSIEIDFGFSVNDENGKQVVYERSDTPDHFAPVGTYASGGGFDLAKRSTLLSSLVDGTLIIEVRMRLTTPTKSVPPPFIPENPVAQMIQGVFMDEKYSDIVFEVVGEEEPKDTSTKVDMAAVTFPAHRVIVMKGSSFLAILCESLGNTTTPIQITGVSHDIFRLLLSYIYGMTISNDNMKLHAKEIINAADMFGVPSLKLEAEARLVEDTVITIENVMDLLVYAECKNCALLKEAAVDFIVDNKAEVIEKLSFANAPGALITEVLATIWRRELNEHIIDSSNLASLRISELRTKAHGKGVDVDGSRETLIAALKSAYEAELEAARAMPLPEYDDDDLLDDVDEESDEELEEE